MECRGKSGIHAMVVPYPGQGHINPMMQLAKKLASKGITITFVLTHSWSNMISQDHGDNSVDAFAHARNLGLDIRLLAIPDCVPGEFERWNKLDEFFQSLDNMEGHVEELINNLNHQSNVTPVSCIVADTFLAWAVPLAKKLGLLSVSFWPSNGSAFSFICRSKLGAIPLQPTNRPDWLNRSGHSALHSVVDRSFQTIKEADWVVANSFEGIERCTVEALWEEVRVYCVGPLLPSAFLNSSDPRDYIVGTSARREMDCTDWLDDKAPKSVIYVSFGSLVAVSASQIEEIAMGLKKSKYSFIWVLRPPPGEEATDVSAMLPEGFLEETKRRGLVVPWCSQMKVLSHPSIGGFFSHCGWNSTIESISSGIPMLGFPLGMDQITNCELIADEWKVGLRLRNKDDNDNVIAREEIAEKVRKLMEGEEMRIAVERLRDIVKMEVNDGGSSANNLERVADGLKAKVIENDL